MQSKVWWLHELAGQIYPALEQCRLHSDKLYNNTDFAPQNQKDIASGIKKKWIKNLKYLKYTFSNSLDFLANHLYSRVINMINMTTLWNNIILWGGTFKKIPDDLTMLIFFLNLNLLWEQYVKGTNSSINLFGLGAF